MPMDDEQQSTQRTGRFMLIMAWVGGLALLTLLFQDILETRLNPNTAPVVARGCGRAGARSLLERNAQGHYVASGRINGFPVTFLLDTGATDVAIPESLAERLRLQRGGGGISQTANGPVAVWQTELDEVRLGAISLAGVRASILPSMGADDPVLLGMSFLKQLEFTQRDRQLILQQAP